MSKKIFKFPLQDVHTDQVAIKMPKGAQILTAQVQGGVICIWAIVNVDKEPETRIIHIAGTGHELPEKANAGNWIASVQQGPFVWHLFDL